MAYELHPQNMAGDIAWSEWKRKRNSNTQNGRTCFFAGWENAMLHIKESLSDSAIALINKNAKEAMVKLANSKHYSDPTIKWVCEIALGEIQRLSQSCPVGSVNNRYATALEIWNEYKHYSSIHRNTSYFEFLNKRLNPAKQDCA